MLYSGGEVRTNSLTEGRAVRGTEVWNRDPLPPPAPPKTYIYKLSVRNDKYEAYATSTTMEALVEFEHQTRDLGYEFIRLERLDD